MAPRNKEGAAVSDRSSPVLSQSEDEHLYENGFIDRIRVVVHCPHDEPVGKYVNTGTAIATGEVIREAYSHVDVPGSHGAAQVRTYDPGRKEKLDITFCPGKYFHGHNAFCSGDLRTLLADGVIDIVARLGLQLPERELRMLQNGEVELHEVHCTAMLDLGSDTAVTNALAVAGQGKHAKLRQVHTYPPSGSAQTVTFGSGRTYRVTLYNKANEMVATMGDPDYVSPHRHEHAIKWARGKLRVEVSLKSRALKNLDLQQASSWTQETPGKVVREQLRHVRVNEGSGLSPVVEESLSSGERRFYEHWKHGCDLRNLYSSRSRKTYRKRFLELGIDISVPYQSTLPTEKYHQEIVPFSTVRKIPFSEFTTA